MPLKLADMSREYFKLRTQQAQQLVAAEAAGVSTDSFDFSPVVRRVLSPSAFKSVLMRVRLDGLRPMRDQDTAHHSQSVFCLQGGGVLLPECKFEESPRRKVS